MVLLGSFLKIRRKMLVTRVNESPGNLIPFVQPLKPVHSSRFAMQRDEGRVYDIRFLEHELLKCGTTARLGVGLLVNTLEDRSPDAALVVGVVERRSLAEPADNPL